MKWVNILNNFPERCKMLQLSEEDVDTLLLAFGAEVKRVVLSTCALDLRDVYMIVEVEMEEDKEEQTEENTLTIDLRSYPEEMREQIREMWEQDPTMMGGYDIG